MNEQQRLKQFFQRHPHHHQTFFSRPFVSRRQFFEVLGAGVTGSYLLPRLAGAAETETLTANVTTQNKARNVIFILLAGAISHTDTFDLKVVNGTTPADFEPTTIKGTNWPAGLLPKMGALLPDLAIVRSMQAHALVHNLAQHWTQIGRNPAAALGDIAPNIGSVVAIEKYQQGQLFPPFLALNSGACVGSGYFSAQYAPFKITPSATGIANTANPNDPTGANGRFRTMYSQLQTIDGPLRQNSPYGKALDDYHEFYTAAEQMMYNQTVTNSFSFTAADSQRYGNSSFGNACLVAKQVLAANQGTRFILITNGSWDMHQDIYGQQNRAGNNLYTMGKPLDDGYSALIADLKASGKLDETLVVMVGEFGRTVGRLTGAGGRDHWTQQSSVFAGAGVKGGRTIGSTTPDGASTADPGWSRGRSVNPEDIEATVYSALGIDWTTIRKDDPFGRGFEYVPFSDQDLYGPINELWG